LVDLLNPSRSVSNILTKKGQVDFMMISKPIEMSHQTRLNRGAQLTPRLEALMKIEGEQGALCFDQVQRWLAFLSPATERMKEPSILSTERTRKVMRPWIDQELMEYKIFHMGQKGWFWLTSKGLRYFDVPLRYYEPTPARLAHLYAVNTIRYLIAVRRPTDEWRSERILRVEQNASSKQGNKLTHLPDAEVISSNGIVKAIECELTVKNEKYIEEVIFDLAANKRYNAIWYFLPPNVKNTVRVAIHKLPQEEQKRFALYTLKGEPYTD
jgi:hypothetical protein